MQPTDSVPRTICILRLSAIGDVTHVVPVVRAIQKYWPETKITWVCGKLEHQVIAGIEGLRLIPFDKKAGWRGYRDLRRTIAAERFDILLHMQVAARANLVSTLIKAKVRIGWDRARSRDLHQCFINRRVEPAARQHQVQGFLSFARALSLEADEPVWDLPVTPESREFAEQRLPGGQPTLMISPCSSHASRNWPAGRYAAVADYAIDELHMRVALVGGAGGLEAQTGRAIQQAMHNDAINLIGKDTLQQSLALLRRARVVLSPDSGPVHLANALGTPVIGLYASTWSKRSGPYNSLDLCVDKFADAARQYLGKNPEELRWGTRIEKPGVMDLVQVDEVTERLHRTIVALRQE